MPLDDLCSHVLEDWWQLWRVGGEGGLTLCKLTTKYPGFTFLVAALANWGFCPSHVLAACKDWGGMGWVCTVQPSVLCSFVCCWWKNLPKTCTWQQVWEKGISYLSDLFLGLEQLSGNCGCLRGDWLSDCLLWTSSSRDKASLFTAILQSVSYSLQGICDMWIGLKGIWNALGIYKI